MITYLRHRYLGSKDIFHFSTVALRLTQRFRFAHHKELFGGEQVYTNWDRWVDDSPGWTSDPRGLDQARKILGQGHRGASGNCQTGAAAWAEDKKTGKKDVTAWCRVAFASPPTAQADYRRGRGWWEEPQGASQEVDAVGWRREGGSRGGEGGQVPLCWSAWRREESINVKRISRDNFAHQPVMGAIQVSESRKKCYRGAKLVQGAVG